MSYHAWLSFPPPNSFRFSCDCFPLSPCWWCTGNCDGYIHFIWRCFYRPETPQINVFTYCNHTYYPPSHWTKTHFPLEVQSLGFDFAPRKSWFRLWYLMTLITVLRTKLFLEGSIPRKKKSSFHGHGFDLCFSLSCPSTLLSDSENKICQISDLITWRFLLDCRHTGEKIKFSLLYHTLPVWWITILFIEA